MPLDQSLVVGGDDDRGADPVHLLEQLHQPLRLAVIEVAGRFVRQQQRRAGNHGARDGDALLLAARQGKRRHSQILRQPHPPQQLRHIGADLPFWPAGDAQRQCHVVERR